MKFLACMSEVLLGRKFYKKSKLLINGALMRIEKIKRTRSVMPKYFRSDIAELLRTGHDSNAFGRVGRLCVYENMLLSYEFVERYCTHVSNQLEELNDNCADECKEAVASLMYAAARFGDLPELRELRSLFFDIFGNSLQSFINKEFIDLLNLDSLTNSPTKEMKIQFMRELAQEHGVEWFGTVGDDQGNEPCVTDHKNVQEKVNNDSNDGKKDESDDDNHDADDENHDDIVKQTEKMRQRILNYISRTDDDNHDDIVKQTENVGQGILDYMSRPTSQCSITGETSASCEKCSTYFNYPTKSRSSEHDVDKENEDVPKDCSHVKWEGENFVAAPRVKSRRWRMVGALPNIKIHPVESWPEPEAMEEVQKENESLAMYQLDLTVNRRRGHVHPKLPDYDDIIARLASIRAKSCQEAFGSMALVNSSHPCGVGSNRIVGI